MRFATATELRAPVERRLAARRVVAGIGALVLCAAATLPGSARAWSPGVPPPTSHHKFDWLLYESWTANHHQASIPLTRFAWPWMTHRTMCGGAVTGEVLNRQTIATIQAFDRCWADWTIFSKRPVFLPYPHS